MKWYFCFNDRVSDYFSEMIRVCVTSARRHTSLKPHCLYDGEPNALTAWLTESGVRVRHAAVDFSDEMSSADNVRLNGGNGFDPHAARGFYLPFHIPTVENEDEFVLFTDVDVMFNGPVELDGCRPAVLAAASEIDDMQFWRRPEASDSFNSGVMVLNLKAVRQRKDDLLRVLRRGHFFGEPDRGPAIYDQWVLNETFKGEWDRLDDRFNWRAYWGLDAGASIIHFHGPKPFHVRQMMAGEAIGDDFTTQMIWRFARNDAGALQLYSAYASSP